jgi:hypothetical protein
MPNQNMRKHLKAWVGSFEEGSCMGPNNHWTVLFTIPERRETSSPVGQKMQQLALIDFSAAIQTV